jgi:hypothetical protein
MVAAREGSENKEQYGCVDLVGCGYIEIFFYCFNT